VTRPPEKWREPSEGQLPEPDLAGAAPSPSGQPPRGKTPRGKTPRGESHLLDANSPLGTSPLRRPIADPEVYGAIADPQRCGEVLRDFDRPEEVVRTFCERLGIKAELGDDFECVLPDHRGKARVARDRNRGLFVYWDNHVKRDPAAKTPPTYALADVFAARVSRVVRKRGGFSLVMWKLRLLVETGWIVIPAWVPVPVDLPAEADADVRRVHQHLPELFGIHALPRPDDPAMPLGRRFVGEWCGLTETRAENALRVLEDEGILVVNRREIQGRHLTRMWELGDRETLL
jgi:hypothetical protein